MSSIKYIHVVHFDTGLDESPRGLWNGFPKPELHSYHSTVRRVGSPHPRPAELQQWRSLSDDEASHRHFLFPQWG